MKQDAFAEYNPAVTFLFFISAIVFGMFFVHPAYLACSCFCALAYYFVLKGTKAIKLFLGMIPLFILISILNPVFNTNGSHVLFTWIFGRPYTFEALCYGMAVAGMFVSIILWFACYNVVMTSDKFLYLFGRAAPSITLVLTMVLRMVPNFQKKAVQVITARKSLGKAGKAETKKERAENGMTIVSALTSWALEGGIITADSMRSRGYGTGRRTSFSVYRADGRDVVAALVMILFILVVIICAVKGATYAAYTPEIDIPGMDNPCSVAGITAYAILLIMPAALNVMEEIRWRILRSGI